MYLTDLLFTPRCVFCNRLLYAGAREKVCPFCHPAKYRIRGPLCLRCGRPVAREGMLCRSCILHRHEVSGRAPYRYEGNVREALHRMKYGGQRDLAAFFGEELWRLEKRYVTDFAPGLLVPVPLHPKRLRERGFNQAYLLAASLGEHAGIEVRELLSRGRNTDAQKGLSSLLRAQNLSGAFEAIPQPMPGRILLIDDIYTTGSTVEACAAALRRVRPDLEIRFLTVALTPPPPENLSCETEANLL